MKQGFLFSRLRWRFGGVSMGVLAAIAVSLGLGALQATTPTDECPAAEPNLVAHTACRILADQRLEEPLRVILGHYRQRTGTSIEMSFLPVARLDGLVETKQIDSDVVVYLAEGDQQPPVARLPGATEVAWKHPTGEPVWAAVVGEHGSAADVIRFLGGPTGHRLWSESPAGFTIVSGGSRAEAFRWVAENRVAHTYPITAARMLREFGNLQEGLCIDIGCGPGHLDIELAKRSNLTIIGLDIDADMKPLFEKNMRDAGLQERVRFVEGDAQNLPFPDDYADVIVSRGVLTFIPDLGQALREVSRVLKPTGIAFLGGRYVYTPQAHKMTNEEFKRIVAESGVPGAQVITDRGQWVKIVGPDAPEAARHATGGPGTLADRFVADYAIAESELLLLCQTDSQSSQALQRGFLEGTVMRITALYSQEREAAKARQRIQTGAHQDRITCVVGSLDHLPFADNTFAGVIGAGPMLLWGDREKGMAEIYRVLQSGGVGLVGGQFHGMPESRRVSSDTLRASAAKTGIPSIQVLDDMGQWIEIRKGTSRHRIRN